MGPLQLCLWHWRWWEVTIATFPARPPATGQHLAPVSSFHPPAALWQVRYFSPILVKRKLRFRCVPCKRPGGEEPGPSGLQIEDPADHLAVKW